MAGDDCTAYLAGVGEPRFALLGSLRLTGEAGAALDAGGPEQRELLARSCSSTSSVVARLAPQPRSHSGTTVLAGKATRLFDARVPATVVRSACDVQPSTPVAS